MVVVRKSRKRLRIVREEQRSLRTTNRRASANYFFEETRTLGECVAIDAWSARRALGAKTASMCLQLGDLVLQKEPMCLVLFHVDRLLLECRVRLSQRIDLASQLIVFGVDASRSPTGDCLTSGPRSWGRFLRTVVWLHASEPLGSSPLTAQNWPLYAVRLVSDPAACGCHR
jgi:hypothetical protein